MRVPWRKPRDRARWLPIYLRVGRRRSGQSHRSRSKVRAPDANSDYIFHVRSRRASPRRSRSSARPRVAPGPPALGLPNAIEHASRRLIARIPRARATRRAHDANISSASDASIARSPRRRLARCLPANRARRRLGSRPRSMRALDVRAVVLRRARPRADARSRASMRSARVRVASTDAPTTRPTTRVRKRRPRRRARRERPRSRTVRRALCLVMRVSNGLKSCSNTSLVALLAKYWLNPSPTPATDFRPGKRRREDASAAQCATRRTTERATTRASARER